MEEITKAQEEILRALWEVKEGAVSDVLNNLPDPKPAYTTVATVIKVLERKGYVSHKTYGKTHVFFPKVSKKEYTGHLLKDAMEGLFNNSLNAVFSFFVKQKKNVSLEELEELKNYLEDEIKKQKS
ncbi:MAG: BlaI/MecI/CopY family transcriptional regulator [Bacteroidetes bacterium]|nr:BlaI/MecI/CopY family transcriptional regulator [Bacteroidota bacterium]